MGILGSVASVCGVTGLQNLNVLGENYYGMFYFIGHTGSRRDDMGVLGSSLIDNNSFSVVDGIEK